MDTSLCVSAETATMNPEVDTAERAQYNLGTLSHARSYGALAHANPSSRGAFAVVINMAVP